MKLLLLIAGLICCYVCSYSQAKIIGRVKDRQEYLPAVNVVLYQDSVIVEATTTNALGDFVIETVPPGLYQLSVSMIGYSNYTSSCFVLPNKHIITIADIVLEEGSVSLNEIEIISQKQMLDQQTDRMVVNLSGSITSSGNSILEVLQKAPGVVINRQSNSIAINGKSGVRLMINEKVIQVPADVAIQMLEGMNASNVESIELITTPPSKYDADGSGGIIHIITKEDMDYGTNGSAVFTLGTHWAETFGGSININHRTKKAAYFLDYSLQRNHNLHIMDMHREISVEGQALSVRDHSRRENITTQQNVSAGAEWSITERTSIKMLFTGYNRNWKLNAVADNNTQVAIDSTTDTSMRVKESNVWQSAAGSISIQHDFNSRHRIDFTGDYLFYNNDNPSNYQSDSPANSVIDLTKSTPIHFVVGTANYSNIDKTTAFSWDGGLKAVVSLLNNRVSVRRFESGEWITDSNFTSSATLHEQVLAAYLSTQWLAPRQWQINSGVRYEYTHTLITSAAKEDLVKRKYGYLFPTISVKRKLNSDSEVHFSYSRRITRPTYNDMAPYVFFWGPNSFSAGNTLLYPALSDALTTGYKFKQWSAALQYTHTQREIVPMQPEVDISTNSLIFKSQNLRYLNTLALTSSSSIDATSWWEIQGTIVAQYQTARTSHLQNNVDLSLYSVNVNLMNAVTLPKDFSIEVSATYQSRSLSGISNFLPFGSLNAGVQKKLGQSGVLRLSMDDILYKNLWRISTSVPENNLHVFFKYNWHNQFLRLSYTWNLGNTKLKSVKVRSGSEEERKRVSN